MSRFDLSERFHEVVEEAPLLAVLLGGGDQLVFFCVEELSSLCALFDHAHRYASTHELPARNTKVLGQLGLGVDSKQRVRCEFDLLLEARPLHDWGSRDDHLAFGPVLSVESVDAVSDLVVPGIDDLVRPGDVANIKPFVFRPSESVKDIMLLSSNGKMKN